MPRALGAFQFALGGDGSLFFVPDFDSRMLAFVDRRGMVETLDLPPARYLSPRLSPDGEKLAVQVNEDGRTSVSIYYLSGETQIQRLALEGSNFRPVWSPDSEWAGIRVRQRRPDEYLPQRVDGTDLEQLTTPGEGPSIIRNRGPRTV